MTRRFTQVGSFASFVGLLDLYPSATVAYSTRRLRVAYTGPLMRVRNGSNNAEGDLAYDSNNEISANSIITITAVGSSGYSIGQTMAFSTFYSGASVFLTRWYDQSGNNNNATQTTAGNQRRIVNAGAIETLGLNNKPTTNSATALGNLNLTTGIIFTPEMFTLGTIARLSSGSVNINFAGNPGSYDAWWFSDNVIYTNGFGGGSFGSNTGTGAQVVTTERDSTNSRVFISGTQQGTTQSSPSVSGLMFTTVFNRVIDYSSNNEKGSEHIVWLNNKISDRSAIINNVKNYYGIL